MPVQISPLLTLHVSLTNAQGARGISLREGIVCACFSLLALLKSNLSRVHLLRRILRFC